MASVITEDPVERTTLSSWRTMGAMLAGITVSVVGPLVVFVDNQIDANRMFFMAVIFGILAISCYIGCYKLSTERIVAPERPKQKGNGLLTLKGLVKNRPLIVILAVSLLFMTNTMLMQAVNAYLFKDYYGDMGALSLIGAFSY